jgi:hypothetical protein
VIVKRRKELWLRTANGVAAILMVCGFFRWGFPITLWALPFATFFLFSAASWRAGVGTRRTAAGRQLWSQAGGFHRLLSTDSAESGSTSPRARTSTPPMCRSRWRPCGGAVGTEVSGQHGCGGAAAGLVSLVGQ